MQSKRKLLTVKSYTHMKCKKMYKIPIYVHMFVAEKHYRMSNKEGEATKG